MWSSIKLTDQTRNWTMKGFMVCCWSDFQTSEQWHDGSCFYTLQLVIVLPERSSLSFYQPQVGYLSPLVKSIAP